MVDQAKLTDDLCNLLDEYSRDESGICLLDLDCWAVSDLEKLAEIADEALNAAIEGDGYE